MASTSIEWATHVLNAFTGCDRVSPGCAHCYAAVVAEGNKRRELGRAAAAIQKGKPMPRLRYQNDGDPKTSGPGFGFTVHWDKLLAPERFRPGARVFVNSMSDVFHEEAPDDAIAALWALFAARPDVQWLVLTKRDERMRQWLTAVPEPGVGWVPGSQAVQLIEQALHRLHAANVHGRLSAVTSIELPLPNVWLGVSIENRRFVDRADILRDTPAAVRFISAEPLLGPLVHDQVIDDCDPVDLEWGWSDNYEGPQLDLDGIDWVICGGESGPKHRRFDPAWARDLRDACAAAHTAFFFKQMGGTRPGGALHDLPEDLRIRELPAFAEAHA